MFNYAFRIKKFVDKMFMTMSYQDVDPGGFFLD